MTVTLPLTAATDDPLIELTRRPEGAVLAVLVRTLGPSYRDVGAMMVFWPDGTYLGHLSSGCIEKDLATHAQTARQSGASAIVKYGQGSPFFDLQLPCGGGLEIILIPHPMPEVLNAVQATLQRREACTLLIDLVSGQFAYSKTSAPQDEALFALTLVPKLSFMVFGHGVEAQAFAALAAMLNYEVTLLMPEGGIGPATLHNVSYRTLPVDGIPTDLHLDQWTAAVLFFHDHHWEPPILRDVLKSDAFYVGAQGSKRTHDMRLAALAEMGVAPPAYARVRSPIGIIPSARDEKTLAISVLAEVIAEGKIPQST